METILAGIDLEKTRITIVANANAEVILAMLDVVAERPGVDKTRITGFVQNEEHAYYRGSRTGSVNWRVGRRVVHRHRESDRTAVARRGRERVQGGRISEETTMTDKRVFLETDRVHRHPGGAGRPGADPAPGSR